MTPETTPTRRYESGDAQIVESLQKLLAFAGTLDQTRLNPPPDLTLTALQTLYDDALAAQTAVGNARADWRVTALDRATDIDKFETIASQAVAQLQARGASRETVKDGMFYVKKLQGKRAAARPTDNPATQEIDESEKGVSAAQTSSAARLATMLEFCDFIDARTEYVGVKSVGLAAADIRAFVESVQTKHNASINAAAVLTGKRNTRDKLFYKDEKNVCDIGKRFKNLVRGEYGADSEEFQTVNAIPFKKRKK